MVDFPSLFRCFLEPITFRFPHGPPAAPRKCPAPSEAHPRHCHPSGRLPRWSRSVPGNPVANERMWEPVPIGSMYAIYGNMDPINIPPMLAYIPYMDPMG